MLKFTGEVVPSFGSSSLWSCQRGGLTRGVTHSQGNNFLDLSAKAGQEMGLSRGKPPGFNASEPLGHTGIYFVFSFQSGAAFICLHHKGCVLQFAGFLFSALFLIRSDKSLPVAPDSLPTEMQTHWEGFGLSKACPSDGNPLAAAFAFLPPLFLC